MAAVFMLLYVIICSAWVTVSLYSWRVLVNVGILPESQYHVNACVHKLLECMYMTFSKLSFKHNMSFLFFSFLFLFFSFSSCVMIVYE